MTCSAMRLMVRNAHGCGQAAYGTMVFTCMTTQNCQVNMMVIKEDGHECVTLSKGTD